jgi:hypothetical protein
VGIRCWKEEFKLLAAKAPIAAEQCIVSSIHRPVDHPKQRRLSGIVWPDEKQVWLFEAQGYVAKTSQSLDAEPGKRAAEVRHDVLPS